VRMAKGKFKIKKKLMYTHPDKMRSYGCLRLFKHHSLLGPDVSIRTMKRKGNLPLGRSITAGGIPRIPSGHHQTPVTSTTL